MKVKFSLKTIMAEQEKLCESIAHWRHAVYSQHFITTTRHVDTDLEMKQRSVLQAHLNFIWE